MGIENVLFGVDWRKRDYLVSVYKEKEGRRCKWMSDPFTKSVWYESNNEITLLSPEFRKIKTRQLPSNCELLTHHWNRSGLHVLTKLDKGQRLLKLDELREP